MSSHPNINKKIDINYMLENHSAGCNYLACVPIDLILFKKWDEHKLKYWLNTLKTTNEIDPIMLGDFDEILQKYDIIDGIHRCTACVKLKYSHIPAIIPNYINDSRFEILHDRVWYPTHLVGEYNDAVTNGTIDDFWENYWKNQDKQSSEFIKLKRFIKVNKHLPIQTSTNIEESNIRKWYELQKHNKQFLNKTELADFNYIEETYGKR